MGVYYTVYSEIYVKDKWYVLDSYVLMPSGKYKLSPLMCGQSRLREALNNLSVTRIINFSDLSEGTQKHMTEDVDEEYKGGLSGKTFEMYDYHTEVKPKCIREYEYEYYAPRYSVKAFETGEINEIEDWLTRESYDELPPEERKEYVFFKWNEPYGWYKTLSDMVRRVDTRLEDFYEVVSWGEDNLYDHLQHINPVRLIVTVS